MNNIFSIGYSTYDPNTLVELLKKHDIRSVIDVRSIPHSRYTPQWNISEIEPYLSDRKINYRFMGKELGGRQTEPDVLKNGIVDFDLLKQSPIYLTGIDKILELSNKEPIVIACTEKDPAKCHRGVLIFRTLQKHINDDSLIHISEQVLTETEAAPSKRIWKEETQSELAERIWKKSNLAHHDMFDDHDKMVERAFSKTAAEIAWKSPEIPIQENEIKEH